MSTELLARIDKNRVYCLTYDYDFRGTEYLPFTNIESCYVATYERYQSDADKMETVASDVGIIKKIVAEHSIKLSQAAI